MSVIKQVELLIGAALLVGAFYFGYSYSSDKWQAKVSQAELENSRLALEVERSNQEAADIALESVFSDLDRVGKSARIIEKQKIVYRDGPSAGTCKLSAVGVQILNDSAGLPTGP